MLFKAETYLISHNRNNTWPLAPAYCTGQPFFFKISVHRHHQIPRGERRDHTWVSDDGVTYVYIEYNTEISDLEENESLLIFFLGKIQLLKLAKDPLVR